MTTTTLESRMSSPALVLPDSMKALYALDAAIKKTGIPRETLYLMQLRASQINGCSVCVEMHARDLRKLGTTDERLFAVAAWRESPYFTDAERAALALTEALTRVADRVEPVTDEIWNEAARHYDEAQLSGLLLNIGTINLWNRLNIATRQVAGPWTATIPTNA